MAAAALAVRVSAQIAEFQKSFKDASKTLEQFQGDFEGIATRAAAVGSFFGTIAANIATSLARGFGSALADAVKFSSQFNNAFIGLSSVARAFGTNTDAATAAAKRLSADGLLPLKDSALGLKNLLASGFNLEQSTKLMNAFKDSAAFGRVGAISFGDAITSATAGVKNGNSILVDNVGITKNLSQILKEAGFSAQDLSRATTDSGVRMALYNGILKESAAFTGDANRLTQTYQGTLDGMKTSWTNLLATWGDAITQNKTVAEALGFVRDAFTRLNGFLTDNRRGFLFVSDAIILFVSALAGTVRAINAVQGAFNALDTIVVGVTRAFLKSVKAIADGLISLVLIAAKLPGSSIALAGLADEIRTLGALSVTSAKGIEALHERMGENDRRAASWDKTLGGVAGELDGLATKLRETRGQTVQLGTAGDVLGRSLTNNVAGGATKAATALDKLLDRLKVVNGLSSGDLLANVSRPVPPPLDISSPAASFGGISMGAFGLPTAKPMPPAPSGFWSQIFRPSDIGAALGQGISAAVQGGGNVFHAAAGAVGQSFTTGLAKHLTSSVAEGGKAISGFMGGAINAVLPGLGALAGPLVGKITGLISGAFGLGTAGRDLTKQFAETFGGFDALHKKLGELGGAGEQLWIRLTQGVGRNNPAEAKAAIDAINAALGVQSSRLSNAQAVLTEYGITFEQTGEKFRNSSLAAAFDVLFEKTETLKEIGVDYSLILEKQASQYSELTAKAIASNTEIPASMRPLLEKLAELGLLTDAATGEFIDLGNVTWATTLTQGFKSVTDAINRLADALTTGVGGALDTLSTRTVRIPIKFDVDDLDIPGVPQFARGGIVRRPTLALIGEAGPEAVVPLSQLGGGGGSQPIVFQTYLDGRLVAESQARHLPDVLKRHGLV